MNSFSTPTNTLDAAPLPTLNSPPEIPLPGAVFYGDTPQPASTVNTRTGALAGDA